MIDDFFKKMKMLALAEYCGLGEENDALLMAVLAKAVTSTIAAFQGMCHGLA